MNNISIDAHKLVKRIEKDPTLTIIDRYYGANAVKKIKNLLFPNNLKDASIWASKWNNYERSKSVLIIYSRKVIKNTYIHFKFIIGEGDNLSSLGEVIKNYDNGIEIINNYI